MWLFDFYIHAVLQMHFMGPARMIARGDEMEKFIKQFRAPTICKP